MPPLLRRPARRVLLSVLLLTGCAGEPVPTVIRDPVPASLLTCRPEPSPPSPSDNDTALGDYIVALADAGADCRANLAGVAAVVKPGG